MELMLNIRATPPDVLLFFYVLFGKLQLAFMVFLERKGFLLPQCPWKLNLYSQSHSDVHINTNNSLLSLLC